MFLTDGSDSSKHHFLYTRVLGAYHANVMYSGPGMQGFETRSLHFLWVRWYEVVDPGSSGWNNSMLDMVHFPPMHEDTSFGFVDLNDVLQECHILLAFVKGKCTTNINVSCCAKNSKDYLLYYIGR